MHRRQLTWILPLLLAISLVSQRLSPENATQIPLPSESREHLERSQTQRVQRSNDALAALQAGERIDLTFGDSKKTFLFEPAELLDEDFEISLGPNGKDTLNLPKIFAGWAFDPSSKEPPARAYLSILDNQAWGTWISESQSTWHFHWNLDSTEVILSETFAPLSIGSIIDGNICQLSELPDAPASPAREIRGEISAQGGLEPATRKIAHYLDPIPASESYQKSLKDLDVTLVIDQSATGPNDTDSLALVASQWLATAANVATIYENQLGIRLRLQELILIPDAAKFTDIPSNNVLADFRRWMTAERPRSQYQWHSAFKVGAGLPPQTLGLAKVGALGTTDSIGAIRANSGWSTLAHELGHTLGADHTLGGLMNSSANDGGNRDFFTEVDSSRGRTAAWQIYSHSRDRLPGPATLRDPTEIPFANNDFRVIPLDKPITLDPRSNDLRHVAFGTKNGAISIDSVGQLRPPSAGSLSHNGGEVRFQPTDGFDGPAWFSYTLRGSVGNNGEGWLHKGDVTLLVGAEAPSENLILSPGEALTFSADNVFGSITQPRDAIVHWLIDDNRLIIRANKEASGTDSFSIGSLSFDITYREAILNPQPDFYWHHDQFGTLVMHPLVNDISSSASARGTAPELSIGPEAGNTKLSSVGHGLQLTSAELLVPDKGSLEILPKPSVIAGEPGLNPSGTLAFTPFKDAQGTVTIRYHIKAPSGITASETITIYLASAAETLIDRNAPAHYEIPRTAVNEMTWQSSAYNDAEWTSGNLPIGYEDSRGYEDVIQTDVGRQMVHVNSSIYVRIPFEVTSVNTVSRLLLRLRMDDGFVAYLNGKEIMRDNTPGTITWEAQATLGREADTFVKYDISEARSALRSGSNLLAIHGMNSQTDSSDFLLMPELIALTLPLIATIESPAAKSISVALGNGIIFKQKPMPIEEIGFPVTEPITTHWQIMQASNNASLQATPLENGDYAVQFAERGTYTVRLTATDAAGLHTSEDRVIRVGDALPYDQIAHVVSAPDITAINDLSTLLEASIQSDTPWITPYTQWTQLDGPADSIVAGPESLTPSVTFPRAGRYRFRFAATASSITVFRDLDIDEQAIERILIGEGSSSSYQYFQYGELPFTWSTPDFSDEAWFPGGQGLGYDVAGDFAPHINTDIQSSMHFVQNGIYVRYPFSLENARSVYSLDLQLRLDDGGVVYLNGQEVYRQHAPLYDLSPSSTALLSADESQIAVPQVIDLAEFRRALRQGTNVLAIHGLNFAASSSDFLIQPSLTAKLGEGTGAPVDVSQENLLAYALGSDVLPKLYVVNGTLELRYRERSDLASKGGTVVVEISADLKQWSPWIPASRKSITSIEDGFNEATLTGSSISKGEFLRLAIRF